MITATAITEDLQAIVESDRHKWKTGAFSRAIKVGLRALSDSRPLMMTGTLPLVANVAVYTAPSGLIEYMGSDWGNKQAGQPWDSNFGGARPRINALMTPVEDDSATTYSRALHFTPAPTAKQLACWGSTFSYRYSTTHVLSDEVSSLHDSDYDLLLTRCLASLMRELMSANTTDPVQLHRGMGSVPTTGTPAAVFQALMAHYRELC